MFDFFRGLVPEATHTKLSEHKISTYSTRHHGDWVAFQTLVFLYIFGDVFGVNYLEEKLIHLIGVDGVLNRCSDA
jgi:hypothetical protein